MSLNLINKLKTSFKETFKNSIKAQMYNIDHQDNQNPYQPGVKTATLVIAPLIDKSYVYLTKAYNLAFDKNLEVEASYNPHKLFTNLAQLQNQQITLRDRTLALNPALEVIRLKPQSYFGFELQEAGPVKNIAYKLSPAASSANLELEVSIDGTAWETLQTEEKKEFVEASVKQSVKYIRIINTSSKIVEAKIDHFKVEVK